MPIERDTEEYLERTYVLVRKSSLKWFAIGLGISVVAIAWLGGREVKRIASDAAEKHVDDSTKGKIEEATKNAERDAAEIGRLLKQVRTSTALDTKVQELERNLKHLSHVVRNTYMVRFHLLEGGPQHLEVVRKLKERLKLQVDAKYLTDNPAGEALTLVERLGS